jgi:Chaperone of endosialidase
MGKPSAPTPPNPAATAAAQTGTNVATGVANAFLNNVNQVTPEGSLKYDVTGNYDWTDPSTGKSYTIPRFTSTQTLSPQQQLLQTQNDATKLNLATMGNQQSQRVGGLLSQPFDPNTGAPAGGDAGGIMGVGQARTSFDTGGQIQSGFGDAGDITRSYGAGDFSQDRQNVEDALMARMNPQLARERSNIETRLADQGIRYGSQAYTSAMDDYNRQATDTRFGAISQAGQEQQRMMDMAAQRAGFENSAQQQAYDQSQGRAAFANQAQGQQFGQNAQLASFENTGLAQQLAQQQSGFNAAQSQRNQYMQEAYQQRNQPLNEIGALLSGGQVQAPNWLNSPQSQIATTDFAGITNQNFAQQQANYQTANSNWQSMMGGILGLGAGAMKMSDEREKKNIDRVGTVFAFNEAAEREKLPIYEYEYKRGDGARHVGPMAQDVEKIDRGAVHDVGGRKAIDTRRVMGNILKAA